MLYDEFSTYINNLRSHINGMRMWALNGYMNGNKCMGIREDESSFTNGIPNLFAGTIWKAGKKVKDVTEIDDDCTCEIHNQIFVAGSIINISLGEWLVTDAVAKEDRVYFTLKL